MMKTNSRVYSAVFGGLVGVLQSVAVLHTSEAYAVVTAHSMSDFTNYPILATENAAVPPLVMLNMSNDHQLFYKAYDDWTDVDSDGVVDSTYKHSIDYFGYFDSYKCYDYDSNKFQPVGITADKYCDSVSGASWSGNFLNWASMTRMDTVRKILYGGYRSTDTSSATTLERQYLPGDAHSFAKYYSSTSAEIAKLTPWTVPEITLCSTTYASNGDSEDRTEPPLIRVAEGNFALWAANERHQCHWDGNSELESNIFNSTLGATSNNGNDPATTGLSASSNNPNWTNDRLGDGDYRVRVDVCVSDALLGRENCKQYPDGNLKPIGLLQEYGDNTRIKFGLMTGSYQYNKSGGVLRKNIGAMTDEVNTTTDGTFKAPPASGNIISTLNAFRVSGYDHDPGYYNNADNCSWGLNSFTNGNCTNWGNPQAEIFLESLRYLAGKTVNSSFNSNDSGYINNLVTASSWTDPLDHDNYCAATNIINFNASVSSYDTDDLGGVSDLYSFGSLNTYVDEIGVDEGIAGNKYFVGEGSVATGTDGICTPKTLANFSDAVGICPEAPRLEAGFDIAGLAYYANTKTIRNDILDTNGDVVDINVKTYGVSLAPALPVITVPVSNGNTVTILPACRNESIGGNCAIVDFKVVQAHTVHNDGTASGKFYVNWEDSEQGGDYDQDMAGVISYTLSGTNITVDTNVFADSTPNRMGFGYVISGTTQDGFHTHSGINFFTAFADPTGVLSCSDAAIDCETGEPTSSVTYTLGSTAGAGLLKNPLYYAAKWGGFNDLNGNQKPDLTDEWDDRDADWVKGNQDGKPDNYFFAIDPATLEDALRQAFDDILAKAASGTAAAVVSTSREGRGAIYQALYETQKKDGSGDEVKWIGTVRAFWIDKYGYMREDTNGDASLDSGDKAIDINYENGDIRIYYYTVDASGALTYSGVSDGIGSVTPIWDASTQLSSKTPSTRNIFTWIDSDDDNSVDSSEVIDFDSITIDSTNYYFLDVATESEADTLVEYVRGTDQSGLRSRTLGTTTYRLGDIVNSTPTVVGAPAEAFDLLYQDETYATFRKQYKNRRQVVYVGANDGMLHAFNGGFFGTDASDNHTFATDPGTEALGEELWAYVPMNLLPHLKWQASQDYTHVYYMDAKPRVFDAKIFSPDADHPGGWGTVLVAGMRLGGGAMTIDTDDDGTYDKTLQPAYVVMDITNPEKDPTVLAEITAPDLGYTTSYPTAFAVRDADNSGDNKWFLVFGSGPNDATKAIRDDGVNAGLYIYDLDSKQFVTGYNPKDLGETEDNSFVGDPVSVDWNLSFKADSLYFGTVGGTEVNPIGKMYKMAINKATGPGGWTDPKVLIDVGQPVTPTPTVAWDKKFNKWVFFGTGRMFVDGDQQSTSAQTIYGIRDPGGNTSVAKTDLVNVTDVKVYTDNYVSTTMTAPDTVNTGNSDGTVTFKELEDYINTYDSAADGPDMQGWYKNMPYGNRDADAADEPSTRSFSTSALMGDILFTSAYAPGDHICNAQGTSSLYGLYYLTGTASSDLEIFGLSSTDTHGPAGDSQGKRILDVVDLGEGLSSSPSIHIDDPENTEGEGGVTVITQTGTGSIERRKADTSGSERSGEVSWREELVH